MNEQKEHYSESDIQVLEGLEANRFLYDFLKKFKQNKI